MDDLPLQEWERAITKEIVEILSGLTTGGFTAPGNVADKLRDAAEYIDEIYGGRAEERFLADLKQAGHLQEAAIDWLNENFLGGRGAGR